MDAITKFFQMGGYAGYVWVSYGLAAVVLIALLLVILRTMRANERDLARLQDARALRRKGHAEEPDHG